MGSSNMGSNKVSALSRRLVGNVFTMHPVSLEQASWRSHAQCWFRWISLIVSDDLPSDEHESERAFIAGSVLEKALSEQSQTQSVQSHVCSFIRFRNGELLFVPAVYLVLIVFSLNTGLLKRKARV